MLEKTLKDLELKENIEELASMPAKIKALQMENLRNENMLTQEKRSNETIYSRIQGIEEMMSKASEIESRFKNLDKLDSKSILE